MLSQDLNLYHRIYDYDKELGHSHKSYDKVVLQIFGVSFNRLELSLTLKSSSPVQFRFTPPKKGHYGWMGQPSGLGILNCSYKI